MAKLAIKALTLPIVRGRYTEDAPLGSMGWFRTGGNAEILYRPADRQDLIDFIAACPLDVPITILGVMSNTIVRDGGVPGVVIRLGRDFADIDVEEGARVRAGTAALDVNVATYAAQHSIAGLEFLCGIPGTIGGALRMNAGAYGGEVKDILVEADILDRQGGVHRVTPKDLGMSYRHTVVPEDSIFLSGVFQGAAGATGGNRISYGRNSRSPGIDPTDQIGDGGIDLCQSNIRRANGGRIATRYQNLAVNR
jgi:UDP-N-acetylmuramate dehydrogenase